jgi:hypothetical protein
VCAAHAQPHKAPQGLHVGHRLRVVRLASQPEKPGFALAVHWTVRLRLRRAASAYLAVAGASGVRLKHAKGEGKASSSRAH